MSSPIKLESIEQETAPNPDAAVIVLHGLGADGYDLMPVIDALRLPPSARIRFVFPHAPVRPVTINGGYPMRAWYDVFETDIARRADIVGVQASHGQVEALIQREESRGIDSKRIIVAGFSQGGAIALYTGVRHATPLAGIIALSTYLIGADRLASEASPENKAVPILMAHGTDDPVVKLEWGAASRDRLQAEGYAVSWHEYVMGHAICQEEIGAIRMFVVKHLHTAQ
jgi:phospholipase/carboxylesterase